MASILKLFDNVLNPGNFQLPLGKLQVDWNHPLANGLIGCWVPGAMGLNNIGLVPLILTRQANTGFDVTPHGPALKAGPSTTNVGVYATAPTEFKSWTKYSIFYCGMRIGNAGSVNGESVYFNVSYDDVNSSPFYNVMLGLNITGHVAFWNTGGVFSSNQDTVVAIPALNTMFTAGATFAVGGNTRLFRDGVMIRSVAFGASNPTSTATAIAAIHAAGSDLGRFCSHDGNIICAWNRALSDEEMAGLDKNPYSFLIPEEYEMLISPYLGPRWQIYCSKNSGAYEPVTATSTMGVKSYDAGSSVDDDSIYVPRLTPPIIP